MSDQAPVATAALLEALATEMAGAVAAVSGETARPVSGEKPGATAWLVRVGAAGAVTGEMLIGLTDGDAQRLSSLVMGLEDSDLSDEVVSDALREITSQAIGLVSQAPATASVRLSAATVSRAGFAGTPAACHGFTLPGDFTLSIVVGSNTESVADKAPIRLVVPEPRTAPPPALPSLLGHVASMSPNLDLLLDIELPLAVRFGQTELTLNTLARLGPGSVIDLHRSSDEPVDILVGGKVIARGEVVVVEGNYGVRVTEVVSTADRIRSLGA
jgi:flagellar motor switch protein FliN/FliY